MREQIAVNSLVQLCPRQWSPVLQERAAAQGCLQPQ